MAMDDQSRVFPAERLHIEGLYQATVPNETRDFSYLVKVIAFDGSEQLLRDPYSYGPIMGEVDLHLFAEGNHKQLYEKFGAHLREIGGERGTYFAVWAPNAGRVSVVGDFNGWDGRVHPMRKLVGSGVWEIFLPGVKEGAHYKFEIRTMTGALLLKSDPFAFFSQHGAQTSSLVYDLERYQWSDDAVDGRAPAEAMASERGQHLRSPSRLLAANGGGGQSLHSAISSLPRRCCPTCSRWATRISSCSRSPSIRSKARGDIK